MPKFCTVQFVDIMEHHHMHHTPPLHWGYSATPPHHNNTWVPPQTRSGALKRTISESDCEDLFSETSSSKDQYVFPI